MAEQGKQYETVALISLWKSRENSKTDYNGKVQWKNQETNEFNFGDDTLQQQVFYSKKTTNAGNQYLAGSICDKDADGNLVFYMKTKLFVNNSDNENAPILTGEARTGDKQHPPVELRIAMWKNDSTNENAPIFKGKLQQEMTEGEKDDIPF